MKILDLLEDENDTMNKTPAPGDTGNLVTSAQAAVIMGVSMSRIRQLVSSGELKSLKPDKGRRDHMFKRADVEQLAKKDRPITGRPEGS